MLRSIVLSAILLCAAAINFQVHPGQERCFFIKGQAQYHIEYVVSGKNENQTTFTIRQADRVLHTFENVSEHFETFNLPQGGGVALCWAPTDDTPKYISASFFES
jgi:hypothetical protein